MSFTKPLTLLKTHAGFKKYSINTGWMLLGHSTSIISIFINIWIARSLGPSNFGYFSYIFAYVGIFSFIANLGVNDILIRELVSKPDQKDKLLGTAFKVLSYGGILAFFTSSISIFFLETNTLIRGLIVLYSTIFLWSPINVVVAYFQATVQAKRNAQAQIVGMVLTSALKVFLLVTHQGIIWLTLAFVLDYMITSILYLMNYLRSGLTFNNWRYDADVSKNILHSSIFLMLSAAAGYVLLKIDQVMIKFFLDETAVGLYAVAVKLSEIWYFIPSITCASLFPAIINAKKSNDQQYKNRLFKLFVFLGVTGIFIAAPISIFAPQIITLLFGSAYIESSKILQIYVWSGIGLFIMTGINRYFMAENQLKSIFVYSLVSVAVNIVLNFILIPQIGLLGAAWATLVSYLISPIIVSIVVIIKRLSRISKHNP